jgi:hypothetical protein
MSVGRLSVIMMGVVALSIDSLSLVSVTKWNKIKKYFYTDLKLFRPLKKREKENYSSSKFEVGRLAVCIPFPGIGIKHFTVALIPYQSKLECLSTPISFTPL